MIRALIDTNVVFTFLSGRMDSGAKECETIMMRCAQGRFEGCIALHSLSTIWYLTRKAPDSLRRRYIRQICRLLTVCGTDNEALLAAIDHTDFKDFEDAMQDCCAAEAECDVIVTANIHDYAGHSSVPAVTPEQFLRMMD